MYGRPLLYLLALSTIALAAAEGKGHRKLHRLVGGHLRIINPDSDDTELLSASASGSKDKKSSSKADDEDRKTLSQQVADGKYGLIQNELFSKPPKRPGVISYEANPEVPSDNINNLGGLSKNEIWLAENHLLVIKGGIYPEHETDSNAAQLWPPIDDYNAPNRQVKIPANPKVPPPFPVQLTDDGPLQILGTNSSRTLNGTQTAFALPPPEGYEPGTGPYFPPPPYPYPANFTPGESPFPIPPFPPGEYPEGAPFPPFPLNGSLPPYFASLPPGAAILPPPPENQTEQFDEDDPSIYYPPPYSFFYPQDNTSLVPAGPLVPGIILPPPPNFFAPLEDTPTTTTTKKPQPQRTRKPTTRKPTTTRPTTTRPPTKIYPTSTPSIPVFEKKTTKKPIKIHPVYIPDFINNELHPVVTTTPPPEVVTVLPVRQKTPQHTTVPQKTHKVTILRPVKPTPQVYRYNQNILPINKPFAQYGPPQRPTIVTTTQVPLKVYYSTANEIESNSVTQSPEKFHIGIGQQNAQKPKVQKPSKKPAQQFYFYEEDDIQTNSITTLKPVPKDPYLNIPKDYYVPAKPVAPQQPQYVYVTARPYNTQKPRFRLVQQPKDSFSIHIARLQKQIHQYHTTPTPIYRPVNRPRPVYQYSFQAANYNKNKNVFKPSLQDDQRDDKFRPLPKYSVQIQQAVEIIPSTESPAPVYYRPRFTENTDRPTAAKYYSSSRPDYQYEQPKQPYVVATPTPISQYSFEATPNPVYQGYYTKPDEGYFDDITKKYFTMFGKKLPSGTTPIPQIEQTTAAPNYNRPRPQKPISLEGDTLVNYVNPRPQINPDAEIINTPRNKYPQVVKYVPREPVHQQQYLQEKPPRPNPEIIRAIPVEVPQQNDQSSYISYQLPGDEGAHFYFLTPQLAQRTDQGAGYFYNARPGNRRRREEYEEDSKR